MANKTLTYTLHQRKSTVGKTQGKMVQVALPSGRSRVNFRHFCERVAKATTFTHQEVAAVLNYATEIAKDIVSEGNMVEFGDLGVLKPSFKSMLVPVEEKFLASKHILKPVVKLQPSKEYFTLTNVEYERIMPKTKEGNSDAGTSSGGASDTGNDGHGGL
ncbi:HU family DNA-binding protein [Porphyromonas gulae]|uniref:Histidinol phosphate phosphatase n=1 Tax=Porphyromonas gulae TaxID=111105 RepID=A0A0A2F0N4_9PORP|nr:histidinol phosphate phosphatase [Porphyromonas gulae]KGN83585.1 histidinol phosphate phosphatase [Porphyromonas gulae]KKC51760.1 histidinol phosphate phosphatase [Porphyromonas gulae]